MSFLATTSGVSGDDVRDFMLAAVAHRFGVVNRLPVTIEWLSDNGSCYVIGETRPLAIGWSPHGHRAEASMVRTCLLNS
jgi:putative transposase